MTIQKKSPPSKPTSGSPGSHSGSKENLLQPRRWKPTFGTMEAHLWQFCQSDREKLTSGSLEDLRSLEAHLWQSFRIEARLRKPRRWKPTFAPGTRINPGRRPDRAEAGLRSVAAVSSLSMALRDDLGRNVKFGRIGKSATYTFLTYLDGQGTLDKYQGKNRNLLVFSHFSEGTTSRLVFRLMSVKSR